MPQDLSPCPFCGESKGYTLSDGSTFRWWVVSCAGCGGDVGECRSDSSTRLDAPKPERWPAADDEWNEAAAHAQSLRTALEAQAAEIARLRSCIFHESQCLDAARHEIARLQAALKTANDQAEHFERQWYLRGDQVEALQAERDKLKTVMIAAAEEIAAHWDAHCDAEGYGPVNLQRRLEEGIPSEYGYTAGAFAALQAERDALRVDAERWRYVAAHWFNAKATWNNDAGNTPKALVLNIRAMTTSHGAAYIEKWVDEARAAREST